MSPAIDHIQEALRKLRNQHHDVSFTEPIEYSFCSSLNIFLPLFIQHSLRIRLFWTLSLLFLQFITYLNLNIPSYDTSLTLLWVLPPSQNHYSFHYLQIDNVIEYFLAIWLFRLYLWNNTNKVKSYNFQQST